MIIDCHLHLQDDVYVGTEGSPEHIVRLLDELGIDRAVIFGIWTTTRSSIEAGEDAARKYPDRLIPFVYAVPSYERPVLSELESALSDRGFRGVKIHAGDCRLVRYIIDPVLELAGGCGVPCLIDVAGTYAAAEWIAGQFPETQISVAHLGKYLCTDEGIIDRFIGIAEKHGNVLLDVSGVVMPLKIADAVRRIGSARVMWGTDGPRRGPDTVAFARMELNKIRALDVSDKERDDVLGQSAARLLKI